MGLGVAKQVNWMILMVNWIPKLTRKAELNLVVGGFKRFKVQPFFLANLKMFCLFFSSVGLLQRFGWCFHAYCLFQPLLGRAIKDLKKSKANLQTPPNNLSNPTSAS